MGRLLLLIPTTSYRAGDFLAAAERLGAEVAVGSNQPQVLEAFSDGATLTVDFADPERGVRQIEAYAARYPLAAIHGVDDGTTLLAAQASAALGLPHNAPAAVEAAGNKHLFRQRLTEAGLPQPAFRLFHAEESPETAARQVNRYPVVLKPLSLAGSRGVIRADDADGFADGFRRIVDILAATETETGLAAPPEVLAEEYLPGREVALEGLLRDGRLHRLALFDKPDPMEGPTFEETIFVTPSRLSAETQAEAEAMTQRAVDALGLRDGPVHAELRVGESGVVPVEVAARSIGGLCSRVLRFGTGISLEELIIRHALGQPLDVMQREARAAGVMMLPVREPGRLDGVGGQEAARAVAGIEDLRITVARGQRVRPLPEGDRYLGFLFARGEDPEAVETALRRAYARLDVRITGDGEAALRTVCNGAGPG